MPELESGGGGAATDVSALNREATQLLVRDDIDARFGGGKTAYAALVSAAGDTTLITPAAGMRVRVFWVAFVPNSDNAASTLVTVKFGATPLYIGYAMAHWEQFDGGTNVPLVVNLTAAQQVAVTVHYAEVA